MFAFLPRFPGAERAVPGLLHASCPSLAVYNPLTARLLGGAITPWMVYRVVWAVPVALVLGGALHGALTRLQRAWSPAAARAPAAQGRHALMWLAAAGWMSVFLAPRIGASWRALKARNRVGVSEDERALMQGLARDPPSAGACSRPAASASACPRGRAGCSPIPALDDMRWGDPGAAARLDGVLRGASVGEAEVALLRAQDIRYVITRTGTPLDQAMRGLPGPFKLVYGGASYSLYAWRPERWIAPRTAR